MNAWAVFFLGLIAFAALVQCIFVVVAAQTLRSTGERVTELCQRFDADIKPTLEDLRRGAANVRAISDSGRAQAMRVEALLSTTLSNLETTVEQARTLMMQPIESLTELSTFWGGLRRGLNAYRSEPKKRSPSHARRPEDSDEHMFIG